MKYFKISYTFIHLNFPVRHIYGRMEECRENKYMQHKIIYHSTFPSTRNKHVILWKKKNWITKKWTAWWEAMKHSKECQHCRHSSTAAFDKMIYTFVSNQVLLLKFKFEIKINEFVFPLLARKIFLPDWLSVHEFLSAFLFLYF